uniref:Activator 1 subunit 5 n=1 Tax=Diabrotica virgifera virgifera TaxID=50390 RepID=A0A6P7FSY3_DIAVI
MVQKESQKVNLPWVEKYRPSTLDDLVSHEDIIKTVSKFIRDDQVPHLLFYGPPGTGKTSTVLACARQLYTPAQFPSMTSIVRRFCYDEFTRYYVQTMGADFYIKRMDLSKKKEITIRISDIGGIQLNENMLRNYLFNSNIIIIVYDITNSQSFDSVLVWLNEVRKVVENSKQIALFGNKTDLEHKRTIRSDKTQKFVIESRLLSFLVSAKTGENVNASLTNLIAKHFGIHLTRIERERQAPIVQAELSSHIEKAIGSAKIARYNHQNDVSIVNDIRLLKTILRYILLEKLFCPNFASFILVFKCSYFFIAVIEKYTENVRFCIICNYLSKIIPALQSRCTRFRFGPLSPEQILPRLNYVIDEERVSVTEDGKKALLTLANGDMRKVLNVLQSTWLAYKHVTEDNVYTCVGHPLRTDIESIVKWLLNEDFKTTYNNIKELNMIRGLALHDILTEVHKYVQRIEFPYDVMIDLVEKMGEIEYRLSAGANENIQLTDLISAFQNVKDIKAPDESN